MTQPAKAQEPSMEEILASIRRIISDDEAKPAAAAKPEPTPVPKNEPPRAAAPAAKPLAAAPKPAASKPTPLPAAPTPAPPPAAKNSQDDIDAMLASFDNPAPAAPPPAPEPEPVEDDVFELTEQMAIPAADIAADDADDDLEFAESAAAPPPRPEPPSIERIAPVYAAAPSQNAPSMLSNTTTAAVESAFNTLASTVLTHNARTLEDLVKEMLRPMLKSWLDDNLPSLVERIVKAEIERVARGR